MSDRYRTPDGYTVEAITLSGTPDNRDGQWLRVSLHGFHVADVRTVAELEQWFVLGDLEPDGPLAGGCQMSALSAPSWDRAPVRSRPSRIPSCGRRSSGAGPAPPLRRDRGRGMKRCTRSYQAPRGDLTEVSVTERYLRTDRPLSCGKMLAWLIAGGLLAARPLR
jgi:hypothetical protein